MKQEVNIKLLALTLKQYQSIEDEVSDALESVQGMLPDKLKHNYADLFFDLLGVPAETYSDDANTGFCRDYLLDQWYQFVSNDISFGAFMNEIHETVLEFSGK